MNRDALFLGTSYAKLGLCQTMCRQTISPILRQLRRLIHMLMLKLTMGRSESYVNEHMQPADACVQDVLDQALVRPPWRVWNTPVIGNMASIIGNDVHGPTYGKHTLDAQGALDDCGSGLGSSVFWLVLLQSCW